MRKLTDAERAEREAARQAQYEKMKSEREARRAANREAWPTSPDHTAVKHATARAALIPDLIDARPVNSLSELRRIMDNPDEPVGRRVDCAIALLAYEAAPGSMAAPTAAQRVATDSAYSFLQRVAGADGIPPAVQFAALKALSGVQALRAKMADPQLAENHRRKMIQRCNAERRLHLWSKGQWPPPRPDWCLLQSDELPEWLLLGMQNPTMGPREYWKSLDALSSAERQRRRSENASRLLSVTAQNRPDCWPSLMALQVNPNPQKVINRGANPAR